MKKKLVAVFAACMALTLAVVGLAGCSSSSNTANTNANANANANASTSGKYTLVVGFDQDYPPYGFVDSKGEFTGFDIDLATAVAKMNNWDIKLVPIDWDTKDAQLNSGAINCIWNGFTMEGREDGYTFSDPYMLNQQVIVVKKGGAITDEAGLAGKTVITQADSGALEVLEGDKADLAKTFANLQTIADYNNAFMQMQSGLVDAVACDLSIAQYQMSANKDAYTILTVLSSEHYAVGFKKGDTETAKAVTTALSKLNSDGTVKQLCEKYAEYGMSYENWTLK